MDIVGFGAATLDTMIEVERFPRSGEKERYLTRKYYGGGLTATALVAASKLGASCWYGGALGQNDVSLKVRTLMEDYGVNAVRQTVYPPEAEPISATVYLERTTGERTIFWSNAMCPPPVIDDEARQIAFGAKCLFIDRHFSAEMLSFYQEVRSRNIPIVGDFEALETDIEQHAMELVDHLILPIAFARTLTRKECREEVVAELLDDFNCTVVVVTDGENGAWFAEKTDSNVKYQPAFQVDVCDTTGCGDVFHGAYAAALIFGWDVEQRIRFASAAAALTATKKGGQNGSPTREELDRFLGEHL